MIRVSFPFDIQLDQLDPARVQTAGQYVLLENLYTPFLLRNAEGLLTPGAASSFKWIGNELEFEFRKDLVDSEGQQLGVEDAYFSLMRLLVLGTSTHGDLRQLICGASVPKNVSDTCDGVRIIDGKLRLRPKTRNTSILENFSAIDFSIVPRRSVDSTNLRKINLAITSGPYSVVKRETDGTIELVANTRHFLSKQGMPQTARFTPPKSSEDQLLSLLDGKFDVLGPLDRVPIDQKLKISERSDLTTFQTIPVHLQLLVFTSRGMKLSSEMRWQVARNVGGFIATEYNGRTGYSSAIQYFPDGGQGSLDRNHLEQLAAKRNSNAETKAIPDGLIMGLRPGPYEELKSALTENFRNLSLTRVDVLPAYREDQDSPDMPHFYLISMDTGFFESLPNVINSVKSGFLGLDDAGREQWLARYLETEVIEKRIRLLKEIHQQSLFSPIIYPLVRSPYVILYKSPWKPNFSFYYPNSPLWKLSQH